MGSSKQLEIQHLYWRGGFGISFNQLKREESQTISQVVTRLFKLSETYSNLNAIQVFRSDGAKTKFISSSEGEVIPWMENMHASVAQLREKLSLFWHGHFACNSNNPKYRTQYIETLRYHGMGNFKTLLIAVSKSAAMLDYLNNQQNKKSAPNENFARELLELFTLGIGNYTEADIVAAARAFTGWAHEGNGEFVFRQRQHDNGEKTFLGQKGAFGGEEIIDIILQKPRCAEFITEKVYRYFVNERVPAERLKTLSQFFFESQYNIQALMQRIFSSDWFFDKENIASKIKSPVELMIGALRSFNATPKKWMKLKNAMGGMGQLLLRPPNVAGWPSGRKWLDNSTLLARLSLSRTLFRSSGLDPVSDLKNRRRKGFGKSHVVVNPDPLFSTLLKAYGLEQSKAIMQDWILQVAPQSKIELRFQNQKDEMVHLKEWVFQLLSRPEYQLC